MRPSQLSRRSRPLYAAALGAVLVSGCTLPADVSDTDALTIGASLNSAANPFFLAEGAGIEKAAEAADARVSVQYANADVAAQSDQIDRFARQRVDVVIVDAVDSAAIRPAVLRAQRAGVKVVAIDVTASAADATVTSDNVAAGREACRHLIERLGGRGRIALVDGAAVSAISDRMRGCRQAIADAPGIRVVAVQRADLTREKSLAAAVDILTAHPGVQGFFGVNDPTAVGIELAAKQKGADVEIVGVDGARQATESIGPGHISATSAQDPDQLGRTGVALAVRLARGAKVDGAPQLVPTTLVTRANVGAYRPWG